MRRCRSMLVLGLFIVAGCDPGADAGRSVASRPGPPPPPPAASPAQPPAPHSSDAAGDPAPRGAGDRETRESAVSESDAGVSPPGDDTPTGRDRPNDRENPLKEFGAIGPEHEGEAPKFLPPDQRDSAERTGQPAIVLSAGVALPQSLPTGTAMGFSVDYQFVGDGPRQSSRYVWVIVAAGDRRPWSQVVRLTSQGTLQIFVQQWRPEQGPFETMIVEQRPDGTRRQVSPKEPMAAY